VDDTVKRGSMLIERRDWDAGSGRYPVDSGADGFESGQDRFAARRDRETGFDHPGVGPIRNWQKMRWSGVLLKARKRTTRTEGCKCKANF